MRTVKEGRREARYFYLFASPWLIGFLVFALYSVAVSFYYSLTDYDIIHPAVFVGFGNYTELFHDEQKTAEAPERHARGGSFVVRWFYARFCSGAKRLMKVSIFDVAKKSGLSVVTVSRVLNNSSSVRQKNRERVLQAMKELDYQPNAAARSLARGKTGIIGLSLTTLQDSFLDAVVKEINDRLAELGLYLALSIATDEEDAFGRSLFQEDRVDGVILLSPTREEEYVMELKKKKIPFVLLDNQRRNPSVPSVMVDNYKGGYDATMHLIGLGHRRIAHIRGPEPFLSSRERERGYLAAMKEAGLKPLEIRQAPFSVSAGYRIAREWIASGCLPTAVFAADDYMALGVMDALKNEGIRIPGDVSVVGFDDQVLSSEFRPMLTTVRQPADKVGRTGVDLLLKIMEGHPSKRSASVLLEPELIVRESTAPPKTDDRV